jgi:hypothetical protein
MRRGGFRTARDSLSAWSRNQQASLTEPKKLMTAHDKVDYKSCADKIHNPVDLISLAC